MEKKIKNVSKGCGMHGVTDRVTLTFEDNIAFSAMKCRVENDVLFLIDMRGKEIETSFPFEKGVRHPYFWAGVKTVEECIYFQVNGKTFNLSFTEFEGQKPAPIPTPVGMEGVYKVGATKDDYEFRNNII